MNRLAIRTILWMLVAMLLLLGVARFAFYQEKTRIQSEVVLSMLDMGLGDELALLEAAAPNERTSMLQNLPRAVQRDAEIVPVSALPDGFFDTLKLDDRPIWLQNGIVWAQIDPHQALRFTTVAALEPSVAARGGMLAATVLIIVLTSIGIAAPLVSRLRRLTTASQEVAGGNLGVRVRDKSNDAIGKLAQQFDKMTATLQRQHEEQASFLQGVTHELATPLARLEFALELLEQAPDDDSRANRTDALRRELGELGALADEILEWSCQSPDAVVEPEPIDLVDVVRDLIERTATNGTHIALNAPESESVAGELRSVQRALDNVLRNALSYADSRVLVRVKATAEHVEVWFEDDGPGVPETHRTRIFDPFTRADSSRDRRTGGAGLGLSIVRRIVERHGGEASVHRSGSLGGAAILIRLPR